MNRYSQKLIQTWASWGTRYLPFADAASPDVPLSRLLRLSLFQVSVGMAMVLLVGTLNRVMIVELEVSASLVAIMLSLPVIFAPFRALIGFKSDTHRSALGWKRVPYIWRGTMIQFGGLAIMPFALLVLSGGGEAARFPIWFGHIGAGLAFLLVGAGLHTIQTAGLALATDLTPPEQHPNVVGLMYVMLLLGMVVSSLTFGALLANFSPGRLIQVIQGSAVVTIALNIIALWKQESRDRSRATAPAEEPTFVESWSGFLQGDFARRRLLALGLGTMAFSMQDVLLEPYGGQILGMTVGATTLLTACVAGGGLLGFGLASRVLSRGADPFRMATHGAMVGIPAFLAVIFSGPFGSTPMFALGAFGIGFGGGLFGHGTLTATMNFAPPNNRGLALGAWGAVQATSAGLAVAIGGILRDVLASLIERNMLGPVQTGPATSYAFVYMLELVLLFATIMVMEPLLRKGVRRPA